MAEALVPLFDQIVVKELEEPEMRHSGIVLPPGAAQDNRPPQRGIVLAVGEGLDWWAHVGFTMPVQPGDVVMFPYHCGVNVELNEETLLVLGVSQLLGRVITADVPVAP